MILEFFILPDTCEMNCFRWYTSEIGTVKTIIRVDFLLIRLGFCRNFQIFGAKEVYFSQNFFLIDILKL